jgi:hypothetical protein
MLLECFFGIKHLRESCGREHHPIVDSTPGLPADYIPLLSSRRFENDERWKNVFDHAPRLASSIPNLLDIIRLVLCSEKDSFLCLIASASLEYNGIRKLLAAGRWPLRTAQLQLHAAFDAS